MTLSDQAFIALCEQHALGQHAAVLQPWLRPRVGFSRTADADAPVGASRIGGGPDVPADFQWPMRNGRPLDFLLQINLADLQGLQSGLDLPAQGLLSFFYDTQEQPWGYDPAHGDGHCIVLLEAGDLQRLPAPHPEMALPPAALGFHQGWGLPHPFSADGERMVEAFQSDGIDWDDDEVADDYYDLVDAVADHGAPTAGERHGLGGYSHNVQGDMRLEAELVSHGLYCGNQTGYQDPRRAALEAGGAEWSLLLQLDSDDHAMCGDSGMLYGWIRQSDLAARDLSRTWMRLQSC
ncbi:YwqG family protein [Stenotrophomonas sp. NPDC101269]|uniref:YwqG family protein n=1 Tax=Stenotrophomonas sp. NPDC101269 TaxID=3415003 RepID=UPI003C2B315D